MQLLVSAATMKRIIFIAQYDLFPLAPDRLLRFAFYQAPLPQPVSLFAEEISLAKHFIAPLQKRFALGEGPCARV